MSFMSITGKELHGDIHVSTPSKRGNLGPTGAIVDSMEESTLNEDEESQQHRNKGGNGALSGHKSAHANTSMSSASQFDRITDNVNHTIKELCSIYSQIGYSSTETSIKKSEIFSVIQDTIATFTNNLQREKSNIENECEWLRQQIRIILAMIGDNTGEKLLGLVDRGLVFNDRELYEKGYKDEISASRDRESKNNGTTNPNSKAFYASSPFNVSQIPIGTTSMMAEEDDDDDMAHHQDLLHAKIPQLSLLQQKSKLNSIFLDVLKRFVEIFKKFIEANLIRIEIQETIGSDVHSPGVSESWLECLPKKEDSEGYRELIEKFETVVRLLTGNGGPNAMKSSQYKHDGQDESAPDHNQFQEHERDADGLADEDTAYIISSPRKERQRTENASPVGDSGLPDYFHTPNDLMKSLREVNYKIVRVIRSLKITKITQEVFTILQREIEFSEKELNSRMSAMHGTIERCFELIEALQLKEEQMASIQRRYDDHNRAQNRSHNNNNSSSNNNNSQCSNSSALSANASSSSGSCLLDKETLQFIQSNPREFGLTDSHLQYLGGFKDILVKIKDTKQKKWDHYFASCSTLWEKLGEGSEYIEDFLHENNSLTDEALSNFKTELNRLYSKRSEFIESFILDSKREIEELWSKLFYSRAQKEQFKYCHYHEGDDNNNIVAIGIDKEAILNEHEQELKVLNQEYSQKESILSLYSQLDELLKDQNFLRESSKDSSRLLSKNSCKILLNEEKLRKKINKGLPSVLKQLKAEIIKYNNEQLNEEKKPMTIYGEDFFEKVILIESEQVFLSGKGNRGSSSNIKSKQSNMRSPQGQALGKIKVSKQGPGSSTRPSPIKNDVSLTAASNLAARVSRQSPMLNRRSPASQSPAHSSFAKPTGNGNLKPASRYNSITTSLSSSPNKTFGTNTLRPLNTPLTASSLTRGVGIGGDTSTLSTGSRLLSPLKSTGFNSGRYSLSPAKSPEGENKENSFCTKYSLSPIKISEYINGTSPSFAKSNSGLSPVSAPIAEERAPINDNSTFDSSTVITDDYQTWRSERIRQLNQMD